MSLLPIVSAFFMDARTLTIFVLIVMDLVTGIMAALSQHRFEWKRIGDFYATNVLKFVLGYSLVYAIGAAGLGPLVGVWLAEIEQTAGAGAAVAALVASIGRNMAEVGSRPVPPQP